jgi:HAMP domain-containing protein
MSIRTRLVVLLLALSLLPMLVLGAHTLHSLRSLGGRLGVDTREALVERELARLREKVADAVILYGRQGEALEHLIGDQAALAEAALAAPPPELRVYQASDFDTGQVSSMAVDGRYMTAAKGSPQPIALSREIVALHGAPGVSQHATSADSRRLASLAPGYIRLAKLGSSGVLWHYTSLESGLHSVYPGHGGYPEEFDPRVRSWYREAVLADGPIWTAPFVDVATRTIVSSVAQAIRGPDGEVVGVTGIDVSVPRIFHAFSAKIEGWRDESEAMIVRQAADGMLEVRGHERPGGEPLPWQTSLERALLDDPRAELAAAFERSASEGAPVLLRHPFRGLDSLWSIAQIRGRGSFLAVVVPVATVVAAADRLEASVSDGFASQIMGLAIGLVMVAGLVALMALWTASGFTHPLRLLSDTARSIADGDLGSRAEVRRRDEIGSLADSVNQMAGSIEKLLGEQEDAYLQALKSLTQALQKKDPYTAGHSGRVKHYSLKLGKQLGFDEATLDVLGRGALVHDLGKIGVPDAVLNKPSALDDDEFAVMQQHPTFTASIMRPLVRFRVFAEIAAWHHERWDGGGYPDGLAGEEIPLLARIVAVADAWDAMTGDRIYRKGMSVEKALSILEKEADSGQFDPELIRIFTEMVREEVARGDANKAARGTRSEGVA